MRLRRRSESITEVPTVIDITPAMLARAGRALMAQEAQERLTDIYGSVSQRRAERHAKAALEAALDMRRED